MPTGRPRGHLNGLRAGQKPRITVQAPPKNRPRCAQEMPQRSQGPGAAEELPTIHPHVSRAFNIYDFGHEVGPFWIDFKNFEICGRGFRRRTFCVAGGSAPPPPKTAIFQMAPCKKLILQKSKKNKHVIDFWNGFLSDGSRGAVHGIRTTLLVKFCNDGFKLGLVVPPD